MAYFSSHLDQEFELIEKKELAPLQELIQRLTSINTAPAQESAAAAAPSTAAGPNSLVEGGQQQQQQAA